MVKVCKLKEIMHAVKVQLHMRGNPTIRVGLCQDSKHWLAKNNGLLTCKSVKMLHDDDCQFYGSTQYP